MNHSRLLLAGTTLCALVAQAQVAAPPPDNSAINKRDRESQTLTPDNQSQSKGDVELAAAVRRAVVAQSGLSMDGKNIKIITMNNAVTLRGPVKDGEERTTIDKIARAAAGPAKVDNQLEVR